MARVAPGGKTDEELQTMARLEHARKQKWRSYIDEETGCAYYFHTETGAVQWDPPSSMKVAQVWQAYIDKGSGAIYYHNPITGATQWDPPEDVIRHSKSFEIILNRMRDEEAGRQKAAGHNDICFEHACCPICFDEFSRHERACAFYHRNVRVCPHYVCEDCGRRIEQCPMCRQTFSAREIFHLSDVHRLFEISDFRVDGVLDQVEVCHAISLILHCSAGDIQAWVEKMWPTWDQNKNGVVDEGEFRAVLQTAREQVDVIRVVEPPTIENGTAEQWFNYYDVNRPSRFCGTLFQIERAAVHSYGPDPHSR